MNVVTERRGHALVVRVQRPAKRNAINAVMTADLDAALNELDDNPDLWAGVMTTTLQALDDLSAIGDEAGWQVTVDRMESTRHSAISERAWPRFLRSDPLDGQIDSD
jgi:enoyl-CoA hydratase/carnithine racemase